MRYKRVTLRGLQRVTLRGLQRDLLLSVKIRKKHFMEECNREQRAGIREMFQYFHTIDITSINLY